MWVLGHLDDLESDFSRFHRVEDIHSLPGPRFFRMASRIFAYDGVMSARVRAEQEGDQPPYSGAGAERVEYKPVSAVQMSNPDLFDRAEV
jgi:hypothetical protein